MELLGLINAVLESRKDTVESMDGCSEISLLIVLVFDLIDILRDHQAETNGSPNGPEDVHSCELELLTGQRGGGRK